MRKLRGITINGEWLGNNVKINSLFHAICSISPIVMREFVRLINKIDALDEAVKIKKFEFPDNNSINIEFFNSKIIGLASLYFELYNEKLKLKESNISTNFIYNTQLENLSDNLQQNIEENFEKLDNDNNNIDLSKNLDIKQDNDNELESANIDFAGLYTDIKTDTDTENSTSTASLNKNQNDIETESSKIVCNNPEEFEETKRLEKDAIQDKKTFISIVEDENKVLSKLEESEKQDNIFKEESIEENTYKDEQLEAGFESDITKSEYNQSNEDISITQEFENKTFTSDSSAIIKETEDKEAESLYLDTETQNLQHEVKLNDKYNSNENQIFIYDKDINLNSSNYIIEKNKEAEDNINAQSSNNTDGIIVLQECQTIEPAKDKQLYKDIIDDLQEEISDCYSDFYDNAAAKNKDDNKDSLTIPEEFITEIAILREEIKALKNSAKPRKRKITLKEFLESVKESKADTYGEEFRVMIDGHSNDANLLEENLFIAGDKLYRWGDTLYLDE